MRPDNDEQQPGRWGSNRFIIILIGIVVGFVFVNLFSSWRGDVPQQVQTPSGTSRDQPADSPR